MSPPARSIMNLEEGGKMFFNHPMPTHFPRSHSQSFSLMDIGITLFKNLYSLIPMLACFTNSLQISGSVYEMVNYLNLYI
jgi:hypothetical protein